MTVNTEELYKDLVAYIEESSNKLDHIEMDRYAFGPWSISKLKSLEKCPLQFYLKYILKIKLPKELEAMRDTSMADVGSTAHRILECVMQGKSISDSYKIAKEEFSPSKLSEEKWQSSIESLEMNIVNFKERMETFERNNPFHKVFTEVRLGVTKDWEPAGFFDKNVYFRGVVDLGIYLKNQDLIIIDHKHGGGFGGISMYSTQLDAYKPLLYYGVGKYRSAQSGIHFIKEGKIQLGEPSTAQQVEGSLVNKFEFLLDGAIDTVKEKGYFKHIRGGHCKWCEYDEVCQPKKLLEVEKSTKRFIPIASV